MIAARQPRVCRTACFHYMVEDVSLSVCLSVCLSVRLSVSLSVCLSAQMKIFSKSSVFEKKKLKNTVGGG